MGSLFLLLLCAVLAGLAWAILGLGYKMAESTSCRVFPFMFAFTFAAGIFMLIRSFTERTTWGDWQLWALGATMGLLLYGGIVLIMRAYALGSAAITWTIVNLSLLLPILLSWYIYHEPLYWVDLGILTLFLLMLVIFARSTATPGEMHAGSIIPFLLLLTGIFVNNGVFMFAFKVKDHLFGNANSAAYGMIFYLICAVAALLMHRLQAGNTRVQAVEWRAGLLAAAGSGTGLLLFLAAVKLPAVVVYPLSQGISLLGGVLLTTFIYKERFNYLKALGLALGVAVLITASCRDSLAIWVTPQAIASLLGIK